MIASVTGCSTWSRVFISMNQMRSPRRPLGGVGDELHRAGADIADGAGGADGGGGDLGAGLVAHAGRGGFLDHLLVAALQGAVALEQVDDVAVAVGEDLDLDVARAGDVGFEEDAGVAEAGGALALGAGEALGEVLRAVDAAHALAAAAGHGLDQHRIADAVGLGAQAVRGLVVAEVARRDRNAGLGHQALGGVLEAHGADGAGRRADPDQPGGNHGLGEGGVFRQKAVARMDRRSAALARGVEDPGGNEVAFRGGGGADGDRDVGLAHVRRAGVGFGIDRDGAHAHAAGGADDAAGDLAPVGDEDTFDHRHHIRNMPKRASGIGALSEAEMARPRTSRVCAGSITPSSQPRAVAK